MGQLSRSTYKTNYHNAAGVFANNSTREISELDMRTFGGDGADSFLMFEDDYTYYIKGTTASGTDTYTIADTIPAAYTSGERFLVTFTNANTGAATLNRNSLGPKDLLTQSGAALTAGQIVAGGTYLVRYNGTNYRILNGTASGSITNSAAANELMKSDGTNAVASGLESTSAGDINLGLTATSGTTRTILAKGSSAAINISVSAKGSGSNVSLIANSVSVLVARTTGVTIAATAANIFSSTADAGNDARYSGSGFTSSSPKPLYISNLTTGTPATGIGVDLAFLSATTTINTEIGGTIGIVSTDLTGGSEDFDLVFKTMAAGATAAERLRIVSTGRVVTTAPLTLKGYTVAGLPAGNQGDTAFVTDALAPTFLGAVVGGGAVVTPVFYDGTNWVSY